MARMRNKTIYKVQPEQNVSTYISDHLQARDRDAMGRWAKKGEGSRPEPAMLVDTNVTMA
jgi:hypothetical protein